MAFSQINRWRRWCRRWWNEPVVNLPSSYVRYSRLWSARASPASSLRPCLASRCRRSRGWRTRWTWCWCRDVTSRGSTRTPASVPLSSTERSRETSGSTRAVPPTSPAGLPAPPTSSSSVSSFSCSLLLLLAATPHIVYYYPQYRVWLGILPVLHTYHKKCHQLKCPEEWRP